jgi:hypothetical protein
MTRTKPRSSLVLGAALVAGAVVSSAACLPRSVVGTLDESGGSGGAGLGSLATVTASVGGGGKPSAIALMATELPKGAQPCGMNPCTPPGDMLFLLLDSDGNGCQAPLGTEDPARTNWRMAIGLPAQYQAPGTYVLSDPSIYLTTLVAFSDVGQGSGQTSGAPGAGVGTIEVINVDAYHVSIRLQGMNLSPMEPDGVYIVPRCTPQL